LKIETPHEVPQTVPEASSTAILSPDEKDKSSDGNRACSLVDLENLQKMRFNNLSTRSAHWNPKVFRKIAQLIDPPKSPTETPPESSNTSRPSSPDAKNLASKLTDSSLKEPLTDYPFAGDMAELTHIFDHLPTLQSISGDPNLLQGKFVSHDNQNLKKPQSNQETFHFLEATRAFKGRFVDKLQRNESERIRMRRNISVVGRVFRIL
jgi:hypothetical protein